MVGFQILLGFKEPIMSCGSWIFQGHELYLWGKTRLLWPQWAGAAMGTNISKTFLFANGEGLADLPWYMSSAVIWFKALCRIFLKHPLIFIIALWTTFCLHRPREGFAQNLWSGQSQISSFTELAQHTRHSFWATS